MAPFDAVWVSSGVATRMFGRWDDVRSACSGCFAKAMRLLSPSHARRRSGMTRAAMAGNVRIEKRGHLGYLVFDHPERRNAISLDMWREIPRAAAALEADDEVRVVVLRGQGDVAFISEIGRAHV